VRDDDASPRGAAPGGAPPTASGRRRRWPAALASFEHGQFRWLYAGNLAFFFAMHALSIIVRPWLAYQMTGSALALGSVSFMAAVPMAALAPIGGVLADRLDRRTLIALAQVAVVANEALGLLLYWTGVLRLWHLMGLTAVMGCVFPIIMPARQAIAVGIVGRHRIGNAMALNVSGMNLTRIVAPALAGWLIGPLGLAVTWLLGIALYAVAALCLLGVHRSPPSAHVLRSTIGESLREGFRFVLDSRLVLVLLLFGLVPMFLMMPFQTLLVVFARDVWRVGTGGLGTLNAVVGLGGIVGSVLVALRGAGGRRLTLMLASVLAFGICLLIFALSPGLPLALPALFAANVFASVYGVLNNTAVQILIPDEVRGRISSLLMMSFSLPMLGTLPLSAAAEAWGAPAAVAGASLAALAAALAFAGLSPVLRGMDAEVARAEDFGPAPLRGRG
jgi:MFS family permease